MGAGANRNALPVDDRRDVVRMGALQLEGNHRSLALRRADQAQRIDLAELLLRIADKIMLMRGNALLADRVDIVDGRPEPDRLDDRRRAGLELVRRIAIGDP